MYRTVLLALIQICLLQYSWARAATHVQSVHGRLTARAAPPRGPTSSPAARPSDNDLLTRVDPAKDIGSLERRSQYALQPNRDPLQDAILDGSVWPVDLEFSDSEFLDKAEPKGDAMLGSDIRLALREARRPPSLLPEVLPYLSNERPQPVDQLPDLGNPKELGSWPDQWKSQQPVETAPLDEEMQDAILDGRLWPVDSEFSDSEFSDKAEPTSDAMLGSDIRLALREARRPPSLLPEVLPYLSNERPQPVDQPPDLGNPKELGSWPGQWGRRPVETALMDEDGTIDSPTNSREYQPRRISQPREARKHVAQVSPDQLPSTHRKEMTTATPRGGGDSSGSRASAPEGTKLKPGQAVAHGPGSEPGQGGPAPPDGRPKDGVNQIGRAHV